MRLQVSAVTDGRTYQQVTLSKELFFTKNQGPTPGVLDDRWKAWCEHYECDADLAQHVTVCLFNMAQVCYFLSFFQSRALVNVFYVLFFPILCFFTLS